MSISLIAAMDKNRIIGCDGKLPWKIPEDLRWFKEHTIGKTVVMGRKTYESIGKPLPNRTNLVISGSDIGGVAVIKNPADILNESDEKEIMIIGGASIYRYFIEYADKLYLTKIDAEVTGDTKFPDFIYGDWQVMLSKKSSNDLYSYEFQILDRK